MPPSTTCTLIRGKAKGGLHSHGESSQKGPLGGLIRGEETSSPEEEGLWEGASGWEGDALITGGESEGREKEGGGRESSGRAEEGSLPSGASSLPKGTAALRGEGVGRRRERRRNTGDRRYLRRGGENHLTHAYSPLAACQEERKGEACSHSSSCRRPATLVPHRELPLTSTHIWASASGRPLTSCLLSYS